MRRKAEIEEYIQEAFSRVWLVRKQAMFWDIFEGVESITVESLGQCLEKIDEVCEEYDISFQEVFDDWDCGYWCGILAALRWVLGYEKDWLDV